MKELLQKQIQESFAEWIEQKRLHLDFVNNVIYSIKMLQGWDITSLERWKPGVVRYTAVRTLHGIHEQQIGYAKDEVFAHLQLPPEPPSRYSNPKPTKCPMT